MQCAVVKKAPLIPRPRHRQRPDVFTVVHALDCYSLSRKIKRDGGDARADIERARSGGYPLETLARPWISDGVGKVTRVKTEGATGEFNQLA